MLLPRKITTVDMAATTIIPIVVHDDDTADDDVVIYFDNDNGGGTSLTLGDDALAFWSGSFIDAHSDGLGATNIDADNGGTQDGFGAVTHDGTVWYYECSHPLDSADNTHDFSLYDGSTVGFEVYWKDREVQGPSSYYHWLSDSPNNFGDIVIAGPPSPASGGPVGGFIESANKPAVLSPYLALFGLVIAVAAAIVKPWKKPRN